MPWDLTRSRGYNWIVVLLPFPFPQAPSQPKRGGRCSRDLNMGDSPAINHVWLPEGKSDNDMFYKINIHLVIGYIFDNQHLTIRNLKMISSIHLICVQNPDWLMILGDYTTWYTGVIIIQEQGIRITSISLFHDRGILNTAHLVIINSAFWKRIVVDILRSGNMMSLQKEGTPPDPWLGMWENTGNRAANIWKIPYTLWLFNIAMENGPFIDGLPIKNGDFPWLC